MLASFSLFSQKSTWKRQSHSYSRERLLSSWRDKPRPSLLRPFKVDEGFQKHLTRLSLRGVETLLYREKQTGATLLQPLTPQDVCKLFASFSKNSSVVFLGRLLSPFGLRVFVLILPPSMIIDVNQEYRITVSPSAPIILPFLSSGSHCVRPSAVRASVSQECWDQASRTRF
jgi:hypothetical protein